MMNVVFSCFWKREVLIGIVCGCAFATGSFASEQLVIVPLREFASESVSQGKEIRSSETFRRALEARFPEERNRHSFYRVRDLAEYIVFLKSRILFFQKNNQLLQAFLNSQKDNPGGMDEHLARLVFDEGLVFESGHRLDLFSAADRADSLDAIFSALKELESSLMIQLKKLQVVNDELRSLKIQAAEYARARAADQQKNAYANQLTELRAMLLEKEVVVDRQNADISDLRNQVSALTLSMDTVRDRMQGASEKVDGLLKEIANLSLDLYQKEQIAEDSRQQAEAMAAEFRETGERLRLVHHIIQEKDQHIQRLEEEMTQMQMELRERPADGAVTALRAEMSSAVDGLKMEIARGQEKIRRLEERFQEAALVNAHLEAELFNKNTMLSFLEKQASQKNEMIVDLERGFQIRARQLSEMRDVVKIYQMTLSEYKEKLAEKDRLIKEFQVKNEMFSSGAGVTEQGVDVPDMMLWPREKIREASLDALNTIVSFEGRDL